MIPKFLRDIDILGVKFHFYSGKTLKKSTAFGGILTILLGVFSMLLFIIFGHNFFYRKNPSVTMSVENTLSYEYFDLKQEKVLFAFRIEDYDAHFIDVSNILYFKIYYYTTEQGKNGEYHSIIKDEFLPYHICNDSDFPDVNLTKTYGKLYCPELGGKKFGGYWDSNNLYYFEIQVFFCEDGAQYSANNPRCTSLDSLRKFLNQDDPKFFALYYPLVEFNPLSYNEPLIRRYKNFYYCLSYRLQRNDDIFLKKTIMNDDKGWLLNDYKNITKWGVDSFRTTYAYFSDEDLTKEGSSTKIYEINLYTIMEKNYYTRYYMKIQNAVAITGSIINIIIYFFESLSHFVGGNMQKLEILQNTFDFEGKKRLRRQLTLNNNHFSQISANNLQNLSYHDLNEIQFKFDSSIKKMNKNLQSSLFNLTQKEKDVLFNNNNAKKMKILTNKIKLANSNIQSIPSQDTNENINININKKHSIKNFDKVEQSGSNLLQKLKTSKTITSNLHSYLDEEEELSLGYMLTENIKMSLFYCCYSKRRLTNYFKTENSSLLHWYYVYLIQSSRYIEMVKQFDFIKKLLLNEGQINSLLLLKKINLKIEEERENLITIKNNDVENTVVNYFKNLIKSEYITKTDTFIFENLSEKVKNKIM